MNAPCKVPDYDLSVVVPTHQRRGELLRVLASLKHHGGQSGLNLEVLIVDSSIHPSVSEAELSELNGIPNVKFTLLRASQRGVNSKRNLGLDWARSPVTLFLDDDCEVSSAEFLNFHVHFHKTNPIPILGGSYINEPQGVVARAYQKVHSNWIRSSKSDLPPFVGGNLSIKTANKSRRIRFDEGLCFGGTEKELILRTFSAGHTAHYEPALKVRHYMHMSFFGLIRRAFYQGKHEVIFWRRYSSLLGVYSGSEIQDSKTSSKLVYFLTQVYDFFFHVGVIYGIEHQTRDVSLSKLLISIYRKISGTLHPQANSYSPKIEHLRHPYIRRQTRRIWLEIHRFTFRYLLKPYYFLKFQYEKRIVPVEEIIRSRFL